MESYKKIFGTFNREVQKQEKLKNAFHDESTKLRADVKALEKDIIDKGISDIRSIFDIITLCNIHLEDKKDSRNLR